MMAALWTLVVLLCVVVAVLAFTVTGLMRRVLPALERAETLLAAGGAGALEGLVEGSVVPAFTAYDTSGRAVASAEVIGSGYTVAVFMSSHCEPCQELSVQMAGRAWGVPGARILALQTVEGAAEPLPVFDDATLLIQGPDKDASRAFASNMSPHAFLLDGDGVVLRRVVPESLADLRAMVPAPTQHLGNGQVGLDQISLVEPRSAAPSIPSASHR